MDYKPIIDEIISRTFIVLADLYNCQGKGRHSGNTKLIFPKKTSNSHNGEIRVSEQELRFVFVEQLNKYCEEKKLNIFYSVETPTVNNYSFANTPKVDQENGKSSCIDLCIHDERGNRMVLIEFKALNPKKECYLKDFCKLQNEKATFKYFVQILESFNSATINSIKNKISSKGDDIYFKCFALKQNKNLLF